MRSHCGKRPHLKAVIAVTKSDFDSCLIARPVECKLTLVSENRHGSASECLLETELQLLSAPELRSQNNKTLSLVWFASIYFPRKLGRLMRSRKQRNNVGNQNKYCIKTKVLLSISPTSLNLRWNELWRGSLIRRQFRIPRQYSYN